MTVTLVTGPTREPVTLAAVKAHCRIDTADEDALLAHYVLAAREHIETYTGRALFPQTWDQRADGLGSQIVLQRPPVQSVTSVKYLDAAGVEQTLDPSQYRLVQRCTGDYVVVPAYGVTWPAVQAVESAVTVRFVAGYTPETFPARLRQALLLLVGHWYEHREPVNIGNIGNEIPLGFEALVFPFRTF